MRSVIITGCASGVGLHAALAFARAGDRVHATVRDETRAEALVSAVQAEGLPIVIETLDMTRPGRFADYVDTVVAAEGRIDVLVNNAGVLPVGAFEDLGEASLRATMEVNFFGPALLTQAVLPIMRRQRGGCIIMVSSLSGMAAKAGDSAYSASKFALEGLTEALSQEVARWNIRTALVHPAQYATSMFRITEGGSLGDCAADSPYRALIESQQRALRAALPHGRDPQLLAELLVRIADSDGSRFRWPADELAERVARTLFAQDDATRQRFLREVSGAQWWIDGDLTPREVQP